MADEEERIWLLDVPVPPSANNLYRNVRRRGRVRTAEYSSWLQAAQLVIQSQVTRAIAARRPTDFFGINLIARINHRRDLDNLVKPTLDLLRRLGLVPDDRWCNRIIARRNLSGRAADNRMDLTILSLEEEK